jgi:hypothetical protein
VPRPELFLARAAPAALRVNPQPADKLVREWLADSVGVDDDLEIIEMDELDIDHSCQYPNRFV